MASTIKVDNVQNQPGTNIINKCSVTTTIGAGAGETIKACAATVTLGRCGGTVALASGATQTGFGASGAVSWVTTPKVTGDSPVTGVTGNGYFMNTTAGAITLNLPAGTAGDIVAVADYAATFATNVLSITPNGAEKIGGLSGTVGLGINGQAATFVYVDSTQGWVNTMDSTSDIRATTYISATGGSVSTCGNYKTHIFTGPGTFTVSSAGTPTNDEAQYFVLAGGGSGAVSHGGGGQGGGGGGGFRVYDGCSPATPPLNAPAALTVTAGSFSIAVGGGAGAGIVAPGCAANGVKGSDSTYSTITSAGGGFGSLCGWNTCGAGGPGGSGGGGGRGNANTAVGGSSSPVTSPAQGQSGGAGNPQACQGPPTPVAARNGGGGGGASAVGAQGAPGSSGAGGAGSYVCSTFIGPSGPTVGTPGPIGPGRYFSGGGGGSGGGGVGAGGTGGGTAGVQGSSGTNASSNTGGGGGSANTAPNPAGLAGAGGSGLVVIKYKYQ